MSGWAAAVGTAVFAAAGATAGFMASSLLLEEKILNISSTSQILILWFYMCCYRPHYPL